jgi:hypothetical protein
MNGHFTSLKMRCARERAAKIRRDWSSAERKRREELPPDTPWRLWQVVLEAGLRASTAADRRWQAAPAIARR